MTELVPQYLQNKGIKAIQDRGLLRDILSEGYLKGGDLLVSAPGSGLSVNVAAGSAIVQGDDAVRQGSYRVENDAVKNLTVTSNSSGSPRLDIVIFRVFDSEHGGASDTGQLLVVPGTPTSGATLDNRNGAPALPNTAIHLADVLVTSGLANIVAGNIRDKRVAVSSAASAVELLEYVQFDSNIPVTGLSAANGNSVVSSAGLTFNGNEILEIEFFAPRVDTGVSTLAEIFLTLYEGVTQVGIIGHKGSAAADGYGNLEPMYLKRILTPPSGLVIYSVRAYRVSSDGAIFASDGVLGNYVPGFLKITKIGTE